MTNIRDKDMEIVLSGAALGAEIRNIDLSMSLDDATLSRIEDAFNTAKFIKLNV